MPPLSFRISVLTLHNLHNLFYLCQLKLMTVTAERGFSSLWEDLVRKGQFVGSDLCGSVEQQSPSHVA